MGKPPAGGLKGREGRRQPRLRVDLAARVLGRTPRAARVLDLSLTGCLLRSEAGLDVGTVVDIRIELPAGELTAKGRVAETSLDGDSLSHGAPQHLAGIEFLRLPAAGETLLRGFLDAERKRGTGARSAPA
jgi:hypothetical protein